VKRPRIGVTGVWHHWNDELAGVFVGADYTDGIIQAGGVPFAVPYTEEEKTLTAYAEMMDGLLLTGGVDVDPLFFGEEPIKGLGEVCPERDRLEMALVEKVLDMNKPVLAICRGMQVLNVAAGGTLFQDIYQQCKGVLQHRQRSPRWHPTHSVVIKNGSKWHRIFGADRIRVNSFHHQAVKEVAPGFEATGYAEDGVIEAMESARHAFALGIQCHPENLWRKNSMFRNLFAAFVEAAGGQN
jgi:putative glutamine amidotransferase